MKTHVLRAGLMAGVVVVCAICRAAIGQPWAGSGDVNDPYQVWDANDMQAIGAHWDYWDKHFKLMADIDLGAYAGTTFNVIGYWEGFDDNRPFTGVFDGNGHTISNFTYEITMTDHVGLFSYVNDDEAVIKDLTLHEPDVNAGTGFGVGSLVGWLDRGTVLRCGVVGGSICGGDYVGGLVGTTSRGCTMSECLSTAAVFGGAFIGGLTGANYETTMENSYAAGHISGFSGLGGIAGQNSGVMWHCYTSAEVVPVLDRSGAMVGDDFNRGSYVKCFWDTTVNPSLTGIGIRTDPPDVIGLSTTDMQIESTFVSAGWDFATPVWRICEGLDYPRLWWEPPVLVDAPVLHDEPEATLGWDNSISWDAVSQADEYYTDCAEDPNFTSIIYSSGWISETSYEFTGLGVGRWYWYRVKARKECEPAGDWSEVVFSYQMSLVEAVSAALDPNSLKHVNMRDTLLNKIDTALTMINQGLYEDALDKLQNDILQKTDGCGEASQPDKNDWIITCEGQQQIYPLVMETIEYVSGLTEQ